MFETAKQMFEALDRRRAETVKNICTRWDVAETYVQQYVDSLYANHRENPRAAAYLEAEMSLYHRALGALDRLQRESGVSLRGKDVLDVGCGNGNSLRALRKVGAKRVVGLEYADYQIESCRRVCAIYDLDVEVVQDSILNPAFPKQIGQFDVVICFDVLEHVPGIPEATKAIAELLRPGGYAVITIGNRYWVGHMLHDPHYDLPGITLLPPDRAKAYYDLARGGTYDVADWALRAEIESSLKAANLLLRPERVPRRPGLEHEVQDAFAEIRAASYPSEAIRDDVLRAVDELERTALNRPDFSDFFGTPMFTFIARLGKMPPPPSLNVRLRAYIRTLRQIIGRVIRKFR